MELMLQTWEIVSKHTRSSDVRTGTGAGIETGRESVIGKAFPRR